VKSFESSARFWALGEANGATGLTPLVDDGSSLSPRKRKLEAGAISLLLLVQPLVFILFCIERLRK